MFATRIKNTGDLMSIALQAEREAIRRYAHLAENMRKGQNASVAALFERMVIEEQEHERLLLEWMERENIEENPDIGPVSWRDPQVDTTYDDEARDPYYSTPYRALAFAVHNEEIAFRFYTYVAAESQNKTVREYAEVLAREELGHAALLRAERRRAYHAERKAGINEPRLNPGNIHSKTDLLAAAILIDQHLAEEMHLMVADFPEMDSLAAKTRLLISDNEKNLKGIIAPGEDITSYIEQLKRYNAQLETTANDPASRAQRLCACCDRSFAFYDGVVETTSDENIMLSAQKLASNALDRIGALKQAFHDAHVPGDPCN